MDVVVTGGAGFIGSHLCGRLLELGHRVTCVDNLAVGCEENIADVVEHPRFRFVRHDVTQPLELQTQAVFHLASRASPPAYLYYPLETALANSLGTYLLLELALRNGARFLMASTSEIYGDPLEHPQREEYWGNVNSIGIRSCYDESKRFAESLTMTYYRHKGVDARIVRIFNCYGPRCDDGRVVPNFVGQAVRGEPITVHGNGDHTRSLCYVSDMVEGLIAAMFADNTRGGVFNLGNPEEHTMLELAHIVRDLCRSDSPIVHVPPISEDDPQRRCPDISRARRVLGWEPKVGLTEGLEATIAWFRSRKK
ncbi:MAG: SDR family oxidoreductase [Bacteroidetes bacterium]|nr:SDR family oxidoreductase [Bacteroidota bacterium]MCL5026294.1 SDR family oxidoreductase [Chloroflexota bacterium]